MLYANAPVGRLRPAAFVVAASFFLLTPVFGGQDYVTRFDLFTGYTYLNSPAVNLPEHGFHFQAGVRPNTHLSIGFDYSVASGDLVIKPDMLLASLQQSLGAQLTQLALAGRLPAGYTLTVPAHSFTQTFTVGPQLAFRHFSKVTLFVRPSVGAMREVATPHPTDPIATGVVAQLAPSGTKLDWVKFYGAGGGVDLLFTHHLGMRVQADVVRDYMFSDLLKAARTT